VIERIQAVIESIIDLMNASITSTAPGAVLSAATAIAMAIG